jgi:hypothetical protein
MFFLLLLFLLLLLFFGLLLLWHKDEKEERELCQLWTNAEESLVVLVLVLVLALTLPPPPPPPPPCPQQECASKINTSERHERESMLLCLVSPSVVLVRPAIMSIAAYNYENRWVMNVMDIL